MSPPPWNIPPVVADGRASTGQEWPGEDRERPRGGQGGAAVFSWPPCICHRRATSLSCAAVPRLDASAIEVYVFRRRGRRTEFLALRRRPGDSLPGVWQPVTGTLR